MTTRTYSEAERVYMRVEAARDERDYAETAMACARAEHTAKKLEAAWRADYPEHAAAVDAQLVAEKLERDARQLERDAENTKRFEEREYGI